MLMAFAFDTVSCPVLLVTVVLVSELVGLLRCLEEDPE